MTSLAPPPTAAEPAPDEPLMAVACPGCHGALAAARIAAGGTARCPLCHAAFRLPASPRTRKPIEPQAAAASEPHHDGPLRQLREARSRRRSRRNVVMLVSGVVILLAIVLLFGTRRPKKRR